MGGVSEKTDEELGNERTVNRRAVLALNSHTESLVGHEVGATRVNAGVKNSQLVPTMGEDRR